MSENCELRRGLRRREKNANDEGAGHFEKPAPDARAAPPEAHESLISRETVAEVPLTGLFLTAALDLAARTFEFGEFLVEKLGVTDVGARFPHKVTYHDGCHGLRELRIKEAPRQLLRAVKDLELVECDEPESCCGFGGLFSVKYPMISTAMAEVKGGSLARTECDYIVSSDPSCQLQLDGWLSRNGKQPRTIHLAEVLAGADA